MKVENEMLSTANSQVSTEKNVPKLRFGEFSDCWTPSSMKEISKINQGLQIPISDRHTEPKEGRYFYITNEFLRPNSTTKYYIENPSDRVVCEERDILMTRTGNTGQVVTDIAGVFHNNFFKIDYSNDVDKHFLVEFLRLPSTESTILKYAGTSTIPDLNHGDFYRLKLALPTIPEQQKIASFLSKVDEKIGLLSEKKAKLTEYKRGVMQQLFNGHWQQSTQEQDGQPTFTPPTLRFKADDGSEFPDWEEKTLIELAAQGLSNGVFNDPKRIGKGYRLINVKDMYSGNFIDISTLTLLDLSEKEFSKSQVKYGDIFFTRSSLVPSGIAYSNVNLSNDDDVTYDGHLIKFSPKLNMISPYYFANYLRGYSFRKAVISRGKQSTMTTIGQEDIKDIRLFIPSLDEQTKIADLLIALDQKIDFTSLELKKAKEWKKGLLQQMFV
ncbi:restriction endonuclease subunit S [Shewanella sp. 10N.286.51.B7]|uniref:restriction endonuclease subunit S n=1 Tax=Shewanella sp. 10N.286.51.B7 TaxID=1880836 RepID=UPI001054F79C|nr:restriction endonuclease subunit S [Shewanella sp. 10N.286.51.B7]